MNEIEILIGRFTNDLYQLLRAEVNQKLVARVVAEFGPGATPAGGVTRGRVALANGKTRRKGPIQLCPIPGCKNRAAPVFNMVCGKHKDLPKATIKKHREARRARDSKKR